MIIAVVDDERQVCEYLERHISHYFKEKGIIGEVYTFSKALNFLYELETKMFDVVFLDIEMAEINGLMTAEKIRENDEKCKIVFFTSHTEYALKGYEYQAFRFLDKFGDEQLIYQTLEAIWKEEKKRLYYEIVSKDEYHKVYFDEIYFLKKDGKYVDIITEKRKYHIRTSLDRLFATMEYPGLFKVDRGSVVNMDHVVAFSGNAVLMRNGEEIDISFSHRKEIGVKLAAYRRGMDEY